VYDYSSGRCDFSSCLGLAYSEVRAAREAECSSDAEYFITEYFRHRCIKNSAIRSTEVLNYDSFTLSNASFVRIYFLARRRIVFIKYSTMQ